MSTRREDDDEYSTSPPSLFIKKNHETESCFGKKTLLLLMISTLVCIAFAVGNVLSDLRISIESVTTIKALYRLANNTFHGENSDGGSSTNTSATNTPTHIATDSRLPTIFKKCRPEEPDVRDCDVGERCTKLSIETNAYDEEDDNYDYQRPSKIENRVRDDSNVNDNDKRKERETWYCIPESYFSAISSSSTPITVNEVRGYLRFVTREELSSRVHYRRLGHRRISFAFVYNSFLEPTMLYSFVFTMFSH